MAERVCPNCGGGYFSKSRWGALVKCRRCKGTGRIPTDDESESDGQQADNGC